MVYTIAAYHDIGYRQDPDNHEQVIEYSFKKLSSKYGNGGYAKMYFPDDKYKDYLEKMNKLFTDKNEFIKAELDLISNNADLKELFDTKE